MRITSHPLAATLALTVAGSLLFFSAARAQAPGQPGVNIEEQPSDNDDHEEDGPRAFFQCRMASGHYLVKLGAITTISKHEYISDGVARVFEVNITTNGSTVARFYYMEEVTANSPLAAGQAALERTKKLVEEAAGRAGVGGDLYTVQKNYPTSTHAHTVEYRLLDLSHLDSLYRSLHRAVETGRGRIWNDPGRNQ